MSFESREVSFESRLCVVARFYVDGVISETAVIQDVGLLGDSVTVAEHNAQLFALETTRLMVDAYANWLAAANVASALHRAWIGRVGRRVVSP